MLQNNAISEISPDTQCSTLTYSWYARLLGVASSYRLKTTEPPHRRSSPSHAHHISSELNTGEKGDYALKIELQDAYSHVIIHPDSTKYLQNKVYQFRILLFFGLNTASQVFTRLGHRVAAYRQGISVILYLDDTVKCCYATSLSYYTH